MAHRVQHSHCSSIFIEILQTHVLALSADDFLTKKNSVRVWHSVRIEPTKLIIVGTRTTYQATGDAVYWSHMVGRKTPDGLLYLRLLGLVSEGGIRCAIPLNSQLTYV